MASSSKDPLNEIYAQEMRNHPYGYALYQPTSTAVLKPGSVGYFDGTGFWSPLADLNDAAALTAAGLKAPTSKLTKAPDQNSTWGVMTSKSVSGHNFQADPSIGPGATGLPLSASIQIKYTSSSTFGAVLVTAPPVTHSAFYYQSPFSKWVADNAHALLYGEHRDDIRKFGLVVVTQTYSTTKCALTAWTEGKGDVFLGFNADVTGVAKVDPSGGWYEGNSASGWVGYEGRGPDKMVVFVGGLWYDCQKEGFGSLFKTAIPGKRPTTKELATEPISVSRGAGQGYRLQGQIWGPPLPDEAA